MSDADNLKVKMDVALAEYNALRREMEWRSQASINLKVRSIAWSVLLIGLFFNIITRKNISMPLDYLDINLDSHIQKTFIQIIPLFLLLGASVVSFYGLRVVSENDKTVAFIAFYINKILSKKCNGLTGNSDGLDQAFTWDPILSYVRNISGNKSIIRHVDDYLLQIILGVLVVIKLVLLWLELCYGSKDDKFCFILFLIFLIMADIFFIYKVYSMFSVTHNAFNNVASESYKIKTDGNLEGMAKSAKEEWERLIGNK